jgi:leucyl-tRNA synthetase
MEYGTGAIMAVPAHDERDLEFATRFALPIVRVVASEGQDATRPSRARRTCTTTTGRLVNSGRFDGMTVAEAKQAIVAWLGELAAPRR